MNTIMSLWFCLCCAFVSQAQTITIKDAETLEAIPLVTLIGEDPKRSATTNAKGQADISAFRRSAEIQIHANGYESQFKSFAELETVHFELKMKASLLNFDEVVVSSTRWKQTSDHIPSKIAAISPKDVALFNPQTAADLLTISGKVFVQKSQQGGGSPMIRGFATNRLLYTVDGVRMNTAIFRGGNIQNVINLDAFATERTEVHFGPGSVIYGSDAIGGVMSFQTLTPQLSLQDAPLITGKAVTRYSSANSEKTAHFDINVGWKKWAIVTSMSAWDFDHLRQGKHGPQDYVKDYYVQRQDSIDVVITQDDPLLQVPSAYAQMNLMQKVRYTPNNRWDFQYGFHYSETSSYGRYDRHNRVKDGTARYAEWNYGPQSWMMNNLTVNHTGDNALFSDMTLRLAQQSFDESRIERSLNKDVRTVNAEHVDAYSVNLDFTKNFGQQNTLNYGLEYILNEVQSEGEITDISTGAVSAGPSRYPNASWSSIAAYITDEWRIVKKLSLQAGIRYNQFILDADFSNNLDFYPFSFSSVKLNSGALTGSFGTVYRPTKGWTLSLNGGTAFRSPNVDDIGKVFDSEPGSVTVPNPNLKAEYAYNVDLGVAKRFGKVVEMNATAYYTIIENALVRRDFQLNGQDSILYDGEMSQVQALQNAASATIYGIQAGIKVAFPAGFSLMSDINYQVGEEELDDGTRSASRHAAPLFGVTRIGYTYKQLTLQFYANYQGERRHKDLPVSEQGKDEIYAKDGEGNTYSPAWYSLNIKALYAMTNGISISAGVENLTDQRYRSYSSGLSAPGRNFIIAVTYGF